MDFTAFQKLLSEADGLGCGFFVFGCFSQIFNVVLLCFLFVLGLKFLNLEGPPSWLAQYLEKIYGSCRKTDDSCNKNGLDHKKPIILQWSGDSCDRLRCDKCDLLLVAEKREKEVESGCGSDEDDEEQVLHVITLRKMVKRERRRGDSMKIEVEKERLAAEWAAEEAMAMILKLRIEKNSVEIEAKQYKRVAEEKQMYDQQVIQSLQWMLLKIDDQEQDNHVKSSLSSSK